MVGYRPLFHRYVTLQVGLDFLRGLAVGQPEAVGDSEYVCVHGDYRLVVEDGSHDIGCLAAYSGQAHETVCVGRNHRMEVADQPAGHVYQVTGLAVGVGDGADQSQYVLEGGGGKVLGCRVSLKQGWSDHIDPFVGTLGREDDRDYELVSVPEVQFGLHGGAVGGEPFQDGRISLSEGEFLWHGG